MNNTKRAQDAKLTRSFETFLIGYMPVIFQGVTYMNVEKDFWTSSIFKEYVEQTKQFPTVLTNGQRKVLKEYFDNLIKYGFLQEARSKVGYVMSHKWSELVESYNKVREREERATPKPEEPPTVIPMSAWDVFTSVRLGEVVLIYGSLAGAMPFITRTHRTVIMWSFGFASNHRVFGTREDIDNLDKDVVYVIVSPYSKDVVSKDVEKYIHYVIEIQPTGESIARRHERADS